MPKKPVVTFEAYNFGGGKGEIRQGLLDSNVFVLPTLKGKATSVPIQFNVNRPANKSTVFVNEVNDGMCVATIKGNFTITKARAVMSDNGMDPLTVANSVAYDKSQVFILSDGKTVNFHVHRTGPVVGNITLYFEIEYRYALPIK